MTKIDFDKIRRENPLPDTAANAGVKLTKDGNEFRACCPFHSEKSASFTIYQPPSGFWKFHCFGCGIHGDVIDFVKESYGYADMGEAARKLSGEDPERRPMTPAAYQEATNPYDGYDIVKPPESAREIIAGVRSPPILNPKRVNPQNGSAKVVTYTPSAVYPYRNKHGHLLGYVLRVEFDDKKITPGVWWTINKAAKFEGWAHGSYPEPRPLYGLDRLYERPQAQVLLVEGEKCADAANAAFGLLGVNVVAVSWMGGGKSLSKTYWKSLKGRSVVIWPDNDEEGWRTTLGYARPGGSWNRGLFEYLVAAEVDRVKIVHITPESRAKGWDIADAFYGTKAANYDDKIPPTGIAAIIKERVQPWTQERFDLWRAQRVDKQMPQGEEKPRHDAPATVEAPQTDGRGADSGGNLPDNIRPEDKGEPRGSDGDATDDEERALEVGRGFKIDAENWRQHLIMKADGDGLKATSGMNVALILQYERRFAGIFAWNSFAAEVYVMRRPPWDISGRPSFWRSRKLQETDIVACAGWLEYTGMSAKINDVGRIIMRVAEHNKYNPVVDAFAALKWDGTRRITGDGWKTNGWLTEYLGADATEINNVFGLKWLVGAVARAMEPGCKVDTMIVLEGKQGLKKSTALQVLSDGLAPGLFTDEMSDPNSKDAGLQMQGAFIVEISELDAFRRAETSSVKSWLSRRVDRFRRPYGKIVEDFPRACVFAGTVNPTAGAGYLKDPTGARRFWPIEAKSIDIQKLQAAAPQLWAEAFHLYKSGQQWWLTKDEEDQAIQVQAGRYEEDPYGELIDDLTRGTTRVKLQSVMAHLDIPKKDRNALIARRITSHLAIAGWRRAEFADGVYYVRELVDAEGVSMETPTAYDEELIPDI